MTGINMKNKFTKNKGFTLMELLVAVAIFSVTITIVSDIYLSTVGSQRKSFGQQDVLDSSRFAIESMARAIRQSTIVSATPVSLEINHPDKGTVRYDLNGGRLMETDSPLTADNVVVEKLSVLTSGLDGNDDEQPRVTIGLVIKSKNLKAREQTQMTVQTTITPRKLQLR
jgi:prepilin-type N-terminal cleavage/methylation domain-containing protein